MNTQTPPFFLTYWNPFDSNSPGVGKSFLNYVKDVSLVNYNADLIGNHLNENTNRIISELNGIAYDLNLNFDKVNTRLDIIREQTIIQNVLLKDIIELLKYPDSEKEKWLSITKGLKYLNGGFNDETFYEDALNQFEIALKIDPNDWFVNYYIALIYIYSENYQSLDKALLSLDKSIKYSSIEINKNFKFYSDLFGTDNESSSLGSFRINAMHKKALCQYLESNIDGAILTILNALKENNHDFLSNFYLLKYYSRKDDKNCQQQFDILCQLNPDTPFYAIKDFDIANNKNILNKISTIVLSNINQLDKLIENLKKVPFLSSIASILEKEKKKIKDSQLKAIMESTLEDVLSISIDLTEGFSEAEGFYTQIGLNNIYIHKFGEKKKRWIHDGHFEEGEDNKYYLFSFSDLFYSKFINEKIIFPLVEWGRLYYYITAIQQNGLSFVFSEYYNTIYLINELEKDKVNIIETFSLGASGDVISFNDEATIFSFIARHYHTNDRISLKFYKVDSKIWNSELSDEKKEKIRSKLFLSSFDVHDIDVVLFISKIEVVFIKRTTLKVKENYYDYELFICNVLKPKITLKKKIDINEIHNQLCTGIYKIGNSIIIQFESDTLCFDLNNQTFEIKNDLKFIACLLPNKYYEIIENESTFLVNENLQKIFKLETETSYYSKNPTILKYIKFKDLINDEKKSLEILIDYSNLIQ